MTFALTEDAERDLEEIYHYTIKRHGVKQARKYIEQLQLASTNMAEGYGHYRIRNDINPQMRSTNSGKHIIFGLMQPNAEAEVSMEIVAIFHQQMNVLERLSDRL